MSTMMIGLLATALLVSLSLALGSYIGLLIRELAADRGPGEASEDGAD
jgi:hypothetical protein